MGLSTLAELEEMTSKPEWKDVLMSVVHAEGFDPWSIDVGRLADAYLEKVRTLQELNLKFSANVFLAASILLRHKSDAWRLFPEPLVPPEIPDAVIEEPVIPQLFPLLRSTERKVTFEELVAAIESAIMCEKRKAGRPPRQLFPPEPLLRLVGPVQVFEAKLADVYSALRSWADSNGLVLFSNLLEKRSAQEVVEKLVLLLHLANGGKIDLWQEEFFKEVFISLEANGNGNGRGDGNGKAEAEDDGRIGNLA